MCELSRVISISACLRTHPSSIAMRYVQRQILMGDPDWMEGNYYDITFPRMGMTHARYSYVSRANSTAGNDDSFSCHSIQFTWKHLIGLHYGLCV